MTSRQKFRRAVLLATFPLWAIPFMAAVGVVAAGLLLMQIAFGVTDAIVDPQQPRPGGKRGP